MFWIVLYTLLSIPIYVQSSLPSTPSLQNNRNEWIDLASDYQFVNSQRPMPPISNSYQDPEALIFVGISTFRDSRCTTTIENLFHKAKYPDRIRIGIIQQRHTEEDHFDCINDFCGGVNNRQCKRRHQMRYIEFSHQDSRGPNHARYLQQSLIQDEEFCMNVDTHTDVIQDWDVEITKMWGSINNEYAILSQRPVDISVLPKSSEYAREERVPHICQATVNTEGLIINSPPTLAVHLKKPLLAPSYAAGFTFSKCHAEKNVPADPQIQLIYDGDEFVHFARLWTHGYDVYTPNRNIVGHDYANKLGKRSNPVDAMEWEKNGMTPLYRRFLYDRTMERISVVLGYKKGLNQSHIELLTHYGLGNKRTLGQFQSFVGMNLKEKAMVQDKCKDLTWVAYEHKNQDPWVANGDMWGYGAEPLPQGHFNIPLLVHGHEVDAYGLDMYTSLNVKMNSVVEADIQERQAEVAMKEALTAAHGNDAQVGEVEDGEHVHRGKELWYLFQSIDTTVEQIIHRVDAEIGRGHGHKVMKIVLLSFPIVVFILYVAIHIITNGTLPGTPPTSKRAKLFATDLKQI